MADSRRKRLDVAFVNGNESLPQVPEKSSQCGFQRPAQPTPVSRSSCATNLGRVSGLALDIHEPLATLTSAKESALLEPLLTLQVSKKARRPGCRVIGPAGPGPRDNIWSGTRPLIILEPEDTRKTSVSTGSM